MNMPAEEMTERIVRAISRPCVHILAHPTGRILLQREPFAMDMEKILETAANHGVTMELNAYPARLDLNDIHCRSAAERGVGIAVNTDSHSPKHLAFMRNGIFQARRGHLQKDQVLNTRTLTDLLAVLNRRKNILA
jgi:DNA polymerase (family 10)